ncbi:beta-fibrinogenase brevinase-like [Mugil cephalus]|uniref:beta-fibrinogenase brevinase-like n=1 Tax=Mugil cephalus TaxID=48193 RepID=UPI001FB68EF4|nr:beta-fibrinogenase brevinase-like [Mugil cephalus]
MAPLTLLLVLLWVGTTVSTVVDVHKRIIGGEDCNPTERLYHVKVTSSNRTHRTLCGGSLINDQWVLTVAHCWKKGFNLSVVLGVHPGPGEKVDITTEPEIYRKRHIFRKKIHDIMLLRLPVTTQIEPIDLADCNAKPELGDKDLSGVHGPPQAPQAPVTLQIDTMGHEVQIAGHASTRTGNNKERITGESRTLQCVNVNTVDCTRLRELKKDTPRNYQHWFCGQADGKDSSRGDSGGGVVYNGQIYGVISFTGDPVYATKEAIGFIDLCHPGYLQWIETTIATPERKQM